MPYDIKVKTKTNPLDTLYLDFGRRVIESSTFCSSDERPKEFVASDDDDDGDDAQVSARSLARSRVLRRGGEQHLWPRANFVGSCGGGDRKFLVRGKFAMKLCQLHLR